ncbi:MAG: hypothetical protein IT448_11715 [Phycisphaerales bacterium]|nr:hypothetical protein [Phycisphaerales bacterium]
MSQKDFLHATAPTATPVSSSASRRGEQFASAGHTGSPAFFATFSAADHRHRLENIGTYNREISRCMRKHLVRNYLPAHCTYNLGEYPCRTPWNPDEYDERELDRLKAHGIELIQVFDEWSDALGLFGGDRYTPLNVKGYRRFVEMVHRRGMKILTYLSSGYFDLVNPDFRPQWIRPQDSGHGGWWQMGRCAPASPGWRAYLLPRMVKILDEYGVDGIYNDWGYVPNAAKNDEQKHLAADEVPAFEETVHFDGAVTDLLALMYEEVHRRGGIVKLHADFTNQPETAGLKVYDYLWVGELVDSADSLREAVKNHPPYLVPCIHQSVAKIGDQDEPFLHAIPYMQFPILPAGRPFTGERGMIPGVKYPEKCGWTDFCHKVWEYHQSHPDGPHVYSGWDACPPSPDAQATHKRWLSQYKPLVEEGTYAWLEISDSSLFATPLPPKVVASAFANSHLYLVLANYGRETVNVTTNANYLDTQLSDGKSTRTWDLGPRSLKILQRQQVQK